MYYDSVTGTSHSAEWEQIELSNPAEFLRVGENVLTIHAINASLGSGGFSIDAELVSPSGE